MHQLSQPEVQSDLNLAKPAGIWAGVILVASVSLGLAFFSLFYKVPRVATRAAVTLQVAVPAALALAAFLFIGNPGLAGVFLLQAGAAALMLFFW